MAGGLEAGRGARRQKLRGGSGVSSNGNFLDVGYSIVLYCIVQSSDVHCPHCRPILPGTAVDAAVAALLLDDDDELPSLIDDEFDHCCSKGEGRGAASAAAA